MRKITITVPDNCDNNDIAIVLESTAFGLRSFPDTEGEFIGDFIPGKWKLESNVENI